MRHGEARALSNQPGRGESRRGRSRTRTASGKPADRLPHLSHLCPTGEQLGPLLGCAAAADRARRPSQPRRGAGARRPRRVDSRAFLHNTLIASPPILHQVRKLLRDTGTVIPIGKSAPISIVRRAPPIVSPSLVSSNRRRAKPSLSLSRSTDERRDPESCSSFRSSEEPHAGFTLSSVAARHEPPWGCSLSVPCSPWLWRASVLSDRRMRGLGRPVPGTEAHRAGQRRSAVSWRDLQPVRRFLRASGTAPA